MDDGSRDDDRRGRGGAGATVLRHPFNLGYGAGSADRLQVRARDRREAGSCRWTRTASTTRVDIARLLAPLARGECDLVIGSRFLEPTGYEMGFTRTLGRRFFIGLARLFGIRVTDPTSGFQALDRKVLELYAGDAFPSDYPDVDVLLTAHRCGLRVREIVGRDARVRAQVDPARRAALDLVRVQDAARGLGRVVARARAGRADALVGGHPMDETTTLARLRELFLDNPDLEHDALARAVDLARAGRGGALAGAPAPPARGVHADLARSSRPRSCSCRCASTCCAS